MSVIDSISRGLKPYLTKEGQERLEQIIKNMYTSDKDLNMKTVTLNPFLMAIWDTLGLEYLKKEGMKESASVVLGLSKGLKELNVAELGKNREDFVKIFESMVERESLKAVGKDK